MPLGIGAGTAILAGAGIQGASSLAGGKKGASAATQAAQIQAQAAQAALAQQQQVRQQNVDILSPFVNFGQSEIPSLATVADAYGRQIDTSLPSFNEVAPSFSWSPTDAQLAQTPGYQFTLNQGLNAEQSRLAAMGLGASGSAVRGAGQYATGLTAQQLLPFSFNTALSSYDANLQGYQTRANTFLANTQNLLAGRTQNLQQMQQIYNMYAGLVGTGLQAGGALAGSNLQSANQIASSITGAGAAQASGVVGAANAQIAGLQGVGNALGGGLASAATTPYLLNALGGGGGVVPVTPSQPAYNTGGLYDYPTA